MNAAEVATFIPPPAPASLPAHGLSETELADCTPSVRLLYSRRLPAPPFMPSCVVFDLGYGLEGEG